MAHRVRIECLNENSNDPIKHFRRRFDIIFPNTILYKTDLAMWDALIISAQQGLLEKQQTHWAIRYSTAIALIK